MPKIAAPTVAEHRARQRAALVAAARELLIEEGYAALSFSALAARTGLARPTVYSYFGSKDDLVVALCEAEFPAVAQEIERAVGRAVNAREQVAAFVRAQLRVASQRRYRIAHALANAPLSDDARRRIMAAHHDLMPSAVPIFARAGHPHPQLAAVLLQGLVNAAVAEIDSGQPSRRVVELTVAAALDGVAGPATTTGGIPEPGEP